MNCDNIIVYIYFNGNWTIFDYLVHLLSRYFGSEWIVLFFENDEYEYKNTNFIIMWIRLYLWFQ